MEKWQRSQWCQHKCYKYKYSSAVVCFACLVMWSCCILYTENCASSEFQAFSLEQTKKLAFEKSGLFGQCKENKKFHGTCCWGGQLPSSALLPRQFGNRLVPKNEKGCFPEPYWSEKNAAATGDEPRPLSQQASAQTNNIPLWLRKYKKTKTYFNETYLNV